jgi:ATP-dependent Clp protease ATP-binding subunit ClpC
MFERYREDARRAIYFANWEARQSKSAYIEPAHILLALTHEAKSKANQLFNVAAHTEEFRKEFNLLLPSPERPREPIDIPVSNAGKRVLVWAAEEADRLASTPIGTEHLLLGLLREKKSDVPEALATAGIHLHSARNRIREERRLPMLEREADDKETSLKSLRPFAAFLLLVIVLSLIYLIIRLLHF